MTTTNNIRMFMDLPVELVGEILQNWLELRSLVRFDSAVCSNSTRPFLLKLFSSKNCAQKRTVTLKTEFGAKWLTKRKMQLTRIALSGASQAISKCLRLNSKSIWCAYCTGDDAIDLVATNCRHLTHLVCKTIAMKPNLNAALGFSMSLQDLRLENVKDLNLTHFEDVFLPNLKVISLYGTACDDALFSAVVHTTEALQHLDIGLCVNITDEGLIAMAKHCPLLCSLELQEIQITDGALENLTKLCPHIDNLGLRGNELLTDLGVLSVARNLTQLRVIDLSYCGAISDLSLEHMALCSTATLETLYAPALQQVRVDVLIRLLQECRQLRNLLLDCDIGPYCTEIVPHMRNLRSLLLYCVLSDDCLCLIAHHCQQLQDLGIPCSHKVESDLATATQQSATEAGVGDVRVLLCADKDVTDDDFNYSGKGLLAMMDGLPNLQRLWAPAVTGINNNQNKMLTYAMQRLWQRLRPGLRFEKNHHCFYHPILPEV